MALRVDSWFSTDMRVDAKLLFSFWTVKSQISDLKSFPRVPKVFLSLEILSMPLNL